jgi:hypothetical protein
MLPPHLPVLSSSPLFPRRNDIDLFARFSAGFGLEVRNPAKGFAYPI